MNSDRSIPRYDWRDHFSINHVFQYHREEQVSYFCQNWSWEYFLQAEWNRLIQSHPECLSGVFKMFSALEIFHDLEIKVEITEPFLMGVKFRRVSF